MTYTNVYDIFTFALYFSFAAQRQVGTYNLSDLAVRVQILALWLLLLFLQYSCCKTHLCTCICRCESAEPGAGLWCEWRHFIGRCLTNEQRQPPRHAKKEMFYFIHMYQLFVKHCKLFSLNILSFYRILRHCIHFVIQVLSGRQIMQHLSYVYPTAYRCTRIAT